MSPAKQARDATDTGDDPPTERLSKRERRKRLRRQLQQDVVQVPIYRDRTVPVGRFIVWSWAKRWVTITIAVTLILVGPVAGGWYFLRQRDAREAERLRDVLYTEVEGNLATLDSQIRRLATLEDALRSGQPGHVPAIAASYESVRWTQVAVRADLFPSEHVFREFAAFYRGLGALDAELGTYADAKAVWQWASRESGRSRENAAGVLSNAAAQLRGALASQHAAGQTLLAGVRPSSPAQPEPNSPPEPDSPAETADEGEAAAGIVVGAS